MKGLKFTLPLSRPDPVGYRSSLPVPVPVAPLL
jgi:hypothetical protein